MIEENHIDYKAIAYSLAEANPLPTLIIDRQLIICEHNNQSVYLFASLSDNLRGQSLENILSDSLIIQLAKQSIATGTIRKGRIEKGHSDILWKVTVAPLIHQQEMIHQSPLYAHRRSLFAQEEKNQARTASPLSAPGEENGGTSNNATEEAALWLANNRVTGDATNPQLEALEIANEAQPKSYRDQSNQPETEKNGEPIVQQQVALTYQYFAVIIEDLTEARRLERMQRDFLANISHELRTPLTSVRLLTETLEDVIDINPDRAQEFVEKIETEVRYLSELVAELLDLSQLESGQTTMTIEPIEAERLVREVMARMLPLAQRYRVNLGTDIQQGKTLVAADAKQIMRVLVNLVHNAIKFTPSGGRITIGTRLMPDQPLQRFFVQDTGVGIKTEELPRVFERFHKTDRARSKPGYVGSGGGGTGLGLAIARHVVEAHGGRIHAESIIGQGSTFAFTLPVASREDASR